MAATRFSLTITDITFFQYEFTPYEMGSWMQPVGEFTNIEYLGTSMMNGKPTNKSACVRGFDRVP